MDPEVVQAIHRLIHVADDFEKMGLTRRSTSKYVVFILPLYILHTFISILGSCDIFFPSVCSEVLLFLQF